MEFTKDFFLKIVDKLYTAKSPSKMKDEVYIDLNGETVKVLIEVSGRITGSPIVFPSMGGYDLYYNILIPFEVYRYFLIKNSDALSFVIAHEFGHIMNGDFEPGIKNIIKRIRKIKTECEADTFAYHVVGYDLCVAGLSILKKMSGDRIISSIRLKNIENLHSN